MKVSKNLTLLVLLFFMAFSISRAQSSSGNQAYSIHEDNVLPSKVGDYEKIIKEFMDNVRKYNIPDARWITTQTNDFRYLYVQPIPNMAELDNNKFWIALGEKMGADNMTDLFNRMDKCYDIHFDYIITLDKDLSYMPGGITQTPPGQDYRRFYYFYVDPQNAENLKKSMKTIKDLFQQKGSKMEYRVYRSGYGAPRDFYMVAVAGKDGQTYEAMDAANNQLLGADGDKAFGDMMQYVAKYEEVSGRMRPDLAYAPK